MMPENFAEAAKHYLAILQELATGQSLIKQLKAKAGELEESLVSYMAARNISELRCSGSGKLLRKVRTKKQPVPKSAIVDCCMQHVQDPQRIQRALDALKEQCGRVRKQQLVYVK